MSNQGQSAQQVRRFYCRPMRVADTPQVSAIEQQSFPAPRTEEFYVRELTQNNYAHYWVLAIAPHYAPPSAAPATAAVDEIVVAYGGYWALGDEAHVVSIAVDPAWRRQRLGEWLLWEMISAAATRQVTAMTLEVRAPNRGAAALYEKIGFREVGLRKRYYRDNGNDARLYTLFGLDQAQLQARLKSRLAQLRRHFSEFHPSNAPPQ